jgi:mannose-6-phosphate isomerase-like protein (cupin superfamily)
MSRGNGFDKRAVDHEFVRSEVDVDAVRADGDTARVRTTIDAGHLVQRVVEFAPGRSLERGEVGCDELLFVLAGRGMLHLEGEAHPLEPDTAAYVRGGERYAVENPGPGDLKLVVVSAPAGPNGGPPAGRRVTIRFADQPEHRADSKRTFRYLVNQDIGCETVTQFLGVVEPCRAPDHSHGYDEVGYIVEGQGFAHIDGERLPLERGSCFHLPPLLVHCIENTGPGVMRILGVFHPSGDPASREYDASTDLDAVPTS